MDYSVPDLTFTLPVPPQLEDAVDYRGNARYFVLYWEIGGDVILTDGRHTGRGDWSAYECFVNHPFVTVSLPDHPYDLRLSGQPAIYWLVVDRETRTAAVALADEAVRFLGYHNYQPPLPPRSGDEATNVMLAWLDAQLPADWAERIPLTIDDRKGKQA